MKFAKPVSLDRLISRLKESVPNIDKLLDLEQLKAAQEKEILDEEGLRNYIRDRVQGNISKNINTRGSEFASEVFSNSGKSFVESIRDLGNFIYESISNLIHLESITNQIIEEYFLELREGNINSMKSGLENSLNDLKERMEERDSNYDAEIDKFEVKLHSSLNLVKDKTKIEELKSVIHESMNKFKEVNRELSREKIEFGGDYVHGLLESKLETLDSNDPKFDDIELSEEEQKELAMKTKELIYGEVDKLRKVRREAMNSISRRILGVSGPEEISGYIDSYKELSEENKELLKSVVRSDYLPDETVKYMFSEETPPSYEQIRNLPHSVEMAIKRNQMLVKQIKNSTVGKVCNGGGGAPFSHIASLGFCAGYSAAFAIDQALKGDEEQLKNLLFGTILVASTVVLGVASSLPLVPLLAKAALQKAITWLILDCGYEDLSGNSRCDPIRNLVDSLVDFAKGRNKSTLPTP